MQHLTGFMSLELRCTQPETDLNGGYMAKLKIVKWEKDNDLKTEIFGLQDPENGELKQVAFLVTDPDKFSIFKHLGEVNVQVQVDAEMLTNWFLALCNQQVRQPLAFWKKETL